MGAHRLIEEMQAKKLPLDRHTFTALVRVYGSTRYFSFSAYEKLWEMMAEANVTPDERIYQTAIYAALHTAVRLYAARTLARDLMAEMRRAGYEPNFWVFRNFYFYYAVHDSVHKARTLLYGPLATIPVSKGQLETLIASLERARAPPQSITQLREWFDSLG